MKTFEIGLELGIVEMFSTGTIFYFVFNEKRFLLSSSNVIFNEEVNETFQCLPQ